jgi:hypothetical protein
MRSHTQTVLLYALIMRNPQLLTISLLTILFYQQLLSIIHTY